MSLDVSKLQCVKRGAGGVITAQCPACAKAGGDKSGQHLSILPDGRFNCIVGSKEDPSHNRIIRSFLRGIAGETSEIEFIEPAERMETVYPDTSLAKLLPQYGYWTGRGMSEDLLKQLGGGVATSDEKSKLSGRYVFPLRDLDGRIYAFSGRLVTESSFAAKWKHLGLIKRVVYPWQVTGPDIERTKTCILVESIGDLLALLSNDVQPVLCIFGLNLADSVVAALVGANVNHVVVSLNRDDDPRKGQAAAERISNQLGDFFPKVTIRLPGDGFKDWGKVAEAKATSEFAKLREELGL